VVILRRHDKEVYVLLIFCILAWCWLCLLKTLMHFYVGTLEAKALGLAVFYALGIVLVIVGIIVIVAAIIIASKSGATKGKVRGAGVIMIGPIPIIFGTDKKSVKAVLVLALALTIVALIVILLNYWLLR
jgi:uncharacterized protein (TIGR00304 family)